MEPDRNGKFVPGIPWQQQKISGGMRSIASIQKSDLNPLDWYRINFFLLDFSQIECHVMQFDIKSVNWLNSMSIELKVNFQN